VGCSIDGCAAVVELMLNAQALRRLHLYNNMSDDRVGEVGRGVQVVKLTTNSSRFFCTRKPTRSLP